MAVALAPIGALVGTIVGLLSVRSAVVRGLFGWVKWSIGLFEQVRTMAARGSATAWASRNSSWPMHLPPAAAH